MTAGLLALAGVYAVVSGLNDGGALGGVAVRDGRLRPLAAVGLLAAAVVALPLLFGAPVAATLAGDLVAFEGEIGAAALATAVLVALAVTALSAAVGLPTSLTLATIGAFVGVGLGTPLTVDGAVVARVLVLAVVAPVVGALLAIAAMRLARLPLLVRRGRAMHHARAWSTLLVAVAYGANDGQKMIAVAVVAAGAGASAAGRPDPVVLVTVAALFAGGALVGLWRSGATLGADVLAARPVHLVAGESAAGAAVLASGALGAPVSLPQSLAGAVAGAGATEGSRRVRWRVAGRLLAAWIVTFPAAMLGAALLGWWW